MYIFDLMTNKMVAPVIDTPPYFSWKISSELKNVLQKSYRLRVFQNDRLIWDSGEVFSRRQSYIPYEGEALMPTTSYRWTVDVSCDHGESASAEAVFETASPSWQARWIESSIERVSMAEYKYGSSYRCPGDRCFQRLPGTCAIGGCIDIFCRFMCVDQISFICPSVSTSSIIFAPSLNA